MSAASAPQSCLLLLEPRLEIRDVEACHGVFAAAVERGGAITVDVSLLEAVDTAGIQLLLALRREADRRGVALQFAGHSAALSESLAGLGLSGAVMGGNA